jgi:hypothetical protein
MINVSAIHQHAVAFQSRGQETLQRLNAGNGKKKGKKEKAPVVPADNKRGAVTTKRPEMQFSTDWRSDPRFNPNGVPAGNLSHPDPVNLNRSRNFAEAAQRLADHADKRMDEIRNKGK